jgi:hypothetical protein
LSLLDRKIDNSLPRHNAGGRATSPGDKWLAKTEACVIDFLLAEQGSLLVGDDQLGSEPANGDEMRDVGRENFFNLYPP